MKKIKLCIMATVPVSIVWFYGKQLDYLKEHGFDVTVITSPGDLADSISKSCKLIFIPMSRKITPLKDAISFFRVAKVIKRSGFDIMQYSSPKAALLGSLCGCIFNIPVRLYLMWGIYYSAQTGFKRMFLKIIEKITCALSTHITPDSRGNYEFAIDEGLCPAHKISVIGNGSANGIDLERFNGENLKQVGQRRRQDLNIPPGALVIGFVGRLCRDKGINELVGAFMALSKKDSNIYLLLIGHKEWARGEYGKEIEEAIYSNKKLIYAGYQEQIEEYMACMDIFVLPSYREGFGMVNIEASAMGLPVVSTNIPGPRDSVLDKKTGILVPAKDTLSLKYAIDKLCYNDQLRHNMGKAGKIWAQNFNQEILWEQIVKHRLSILRHTPYI
jgi:glycosyltransferase involved in cell wall biosynthesis